MQIFFKSVRYKNFLSTGNYFNEVNLSSHDVTIVKGKSGAGKSTVLDALCYCLFNKGFRHVPKGNFVNSINGNGLIVETEFAISNKHYLIRRGTKPNIFEIYVDGVALDQVANVRDQQSYLEKQILRLNWKAFTQIVILGSATHVPFMQLRSGDRREIIEELLDLRVFSIMRNLLKSRTDDLKDKINDSNYEIQTLKTKINLEQKYLEQSVADVSERVEKNKKHIAETLDLIKVEQEKITLIEQSGCFDGVEDLNKKLKTIKQSMEKLKAYEIKISHRVEQYKKEIKFFDENSSCPTCQQKITDEWKELTIKNRESSINECKNGLEQINDKITVLEKERGEIMEKIDHIDSERTKIHTYKNNIKSYEKFIEKVQCDINESNKKSESQTRKNSLEETNKTLELEEKKKEGFLNERELYKLVSVLLKDDGVKSNIIRQYVPIINHYINQYLDIMDFYAKFELDENFEESIRSRHIDNFKYSNFSEGEKRRIDLAITLCWRDIARKKNSMSTNLIILDEIFDGPLDDENIDNAIKIIKTMTGQNVFIITHKAEVLGDKFEDTNSRVIEFEKKKNFSYIKES